MEQVLLHRDDLRYAYATGIIRVLEKRLFSSADIERMVVAPDISGVWAVLSEVKFAGREITEPQDYEKWLQQELKQTYKLFCSLSQDRELTNLFLLNYDGHNLKLAWKYRLSGEDPAPWIQDLGIVPAWEIIAAIKEGNFSRLPGFLGKLAIIVEERYQKEKEPAVIDAVIEASLREFQWQQAWKRRHPFLMELFQILIDLANIKSFIRRKILNHPWESLNRDLINHGKIPITSFQQWFGLSWEMVSKNLSRTPYGVLLKEGWGRRKVFFPVYWEKMGENLVLDFLKVARYITFGPEPLVAYLLRKENEISVLRIIFTAKIYSLPEEMLRERITSYV